MVSDPRSAWVGRAGASSASSDGIVTGRRVPFIRRPHRSTAIRIERRLSRRPGFTVTALLDDRRSLLACMRDEPSRRPPEVFEVAYSVSRKHPAGNGRPRSECGRPAEQGTTLLHHSVRAAGTVPTIPAQALRLSPGTARKSARAKTGGSRVMPVRRRTKRSGPQLDTNAQPE
jgi:hypothetical protein